jgi:hypothetical protein
MADSNLSGLYRNIQEVLKAELTGLRKNVKHAPSKGRGAEEKWKAFLRRFLPARYAIESGFVVDSKGSISHQMDLVIFDKQYSALLFDDHEALHIPAEAVFAVFEVKQDVSKENILYAGEKIESVRKLHRTSAKVTQMNGKKLRKKPFPITGGLLTLGSDYASVGSIQFKKAVGGLRGAKKLDVIVSADGFSYPSTGRSADVAVMIFLYELLADLQGKGNPAALDYRAYLKGLLSADE